MEDSWICTKKHETSLLHSDPSIILHTAFSCPFCYINAGGLFKAKPEFSSIVLENLRTRHLPGVAPKKDTKAIDRFPDRIGKKFENFRQTLVRYFKKCMKKLDDTLASVYSKPHPENTRKYKKALKFFRMFYPDSAEETENFHSVFLQLKSLSTSGEQFFDKEYLEFKTCNNKYAKWFFSNHVVRELYGLHHRYTEKTEVYYKILKLKSDVPEEELHHFISLLPSL